MIVRKRPLSRKEIANGEIDCISCHNPKIIVHECKIKIDGITKYLEDHEFYFDNTFSENESTEELYYCSVSPMIDLVLNQGIVTCFAYGQTGSGKTYTMKGIQNLAIDSLFEEAKLITKKKLVFYISFFEIYGGRLYDLLNNKNKLQVLDDKNGKVQIFGLEEIFAETPDDMRDIIDRANSIRTTHNTVTNETSSRSHAICNIVIKEEGKSETYGKLSLVDLAGSERAQETQSNNRQRRAEGAEINKSLLALKECIRALDARKSGNENIHVPFRASKLTHVLRDSFVSKSGKSRIIMISCVSPSYCSSNHSINTLRYSDRLKEQTTKHNKHMNNNNYAYNNNNSSSNNNNNNNSSKQVPYIRKENKPINLSTNNNVNSNINNNDLDSDINANVFNIQDDILNDMDFDDKIDDDLNNSSNNNKEDNNNNNNDDDTNNNNINTPKKEDEEIVEEVDDLVYLKKTVSKEGKYISDDFIKYHQLTEKIVQDEDDIINTHMNVIKKDAKFLTEESELITKIKKIESSPNSEEFKMEEYLLRLEQIIDNKIFIYSDLKNKLDVYKDHIKQEDEMRKEHPQFLVDASEL